MKKSAVILLHLAFWLCFISIILIITGFFYRNNSEGQEIKQALSLITWVVLFPSLLSFYTFYFFLFPRYFQKRKIVLSIFYGLLISFITGALGMIAAIANSHFNGLPIKEAETSYADLPFFMFVTILSGGAGLMVKGFVAWFNEMKLKEELRQKNHEMELALIKAQLDPHFLFNTINNIDVLILKNADQASEYLNKLSDILRFMLYETKSDKISLSKEIEYITKYIELQRIRTSNPDYVHFTVSGSIHHKTIVPIIFIPFIENAFKHTTNKKIENAITIKLDVTHEHIDFLCENKYSPNLKKQEDPNGLGNELIQKRLKLVYPDHKLVISNKENLYSVHLTINHG